MADKIVQRFYHYGAPMKTLSFATFFAALSGFVVVLISARILGAENAADFMAYWGMFFAFAGFIDGLMQETTRAVATSAQKSKKVMHAASPWKIGTLIAVILGIITLATSPLWLIYLLSSDHSLAVTMLAIGVVSYTYQSILSGTLSGLGLWHHYAGLVALDSGIRLILTLCAWTTQWGLPFFLFVTVSGALSWAIVFITSKSAKRAFVTYADVPSSEFIRRAFVAMLASGATAILITGFSPAVKILGGSTATTTLGGIIMAVTLTRAPLLVPLQRFQSTLIVYFVEHKNEIFKAALKPIFITILIGLVGTLPAFFIGPWFLDVFFGPDFEVPGIILSVLTFASAFSGALIITSAAVLASELHRLYVAGWVSAAIIAFSSLLLPLPLETCVCIALLLGPMSGCVIQIFGIYLLRLNGHTTAADTFSSAKISTMPKLTALVTVYHRIDPAQFRACLDSLSAQTRPADDVVIVEDGPLGPQLRAIVEQFINTYSGARSVVLARNMGAGPASAAGLATINTEFMARLDADDVAKPERFERQLEFFEQHPDVDVLGTAMDEFDGSVDQVIGTRRLPTSHAEILRYARLNSPINNPSVMMRVDAVREAGGYRDVYHMEDYDLYARMLAGGKRFHNMPEALTYFRISTSVFERRTAQGMFSAERQMQKNLVAYGLISKRRAWLNLAIRSLYRLLPSVALKAAYGRLFHRR